MENTNKEHEPLPAVVSSSETSTEDSVVHVSDKSETVKAGEDSVAMDLSGQDIAKPVCSNVETALDSNDNKTAALNDSSDEHLSPEVIMDTDIVNSNDPVEIIVSEIPNTSSEQESNLTEDVVNSNTTIGSQPEEKSEATAQEGNLSGICHPIAIELNTNTIEIMNIANEFKETEHTAVSSPEIQTNEALAMDVEHTEGIVIQSNILLTSSCTHEENPTTTKATISANRSSLSLLAQYESESDGTHTDTDSESIVEVPIASNANYRNQVIEINSDSDDESTTDSDSSDAPDVEYLDKIRNQIDKTIEVSHSDDDDDDDDDDDGDGKKTSEKKKRTPPKVKGEMLLDDLPPIQDLHITVPEEECIELGKIHSIVDQLVLVGTLPNSILLNLDTVLFLDKGKRVLGEVFDVLGQVADPLYCIRFNSNEQILEKEIKVGDIVYVAPKTEYTQYVILSSLMQMRGSDASWENDVEPPPRFLDYSDDEEEREARASLRNKDRPRDYDERSKRTRTNSESSIDSTMSSSTMASTSASTSSYRPPHRRGRGRGSRRGRGGGGYQSHNNDYTNSSSQYPQYHPNYNRGSWHSNYYQPFRPGMPMNYGIPPPPPPQQVPHPAMFTQPPPMHHPSQYNAHPVMPPSTVTLPPPTAAPVYAPAYAMNQPPPVVRIPIYPPPFATTSTAADAPPPPGTQ